MTETYAYHPLAQLYPLLEGAPYQELVENIRQNGLLEPIDLYEGQILDGRNRYRACLETNTKPQFREMTFAAAAMAVEYVHMRNVVRRHQTAAELEKLRAERLERIKKLCSTGASSREIAAVEGISHTQARRDVQKATGKRNGRKQGPKEKGKDAKEPEEKVEPKKDEKPEREPGCDDDVFDARDEAKEEKKREREKPAPVLRDASGEAIPDSLRDLFADPVLGDSLGELESVLPLIHRISERLKKKAHHYPFVLVTQVYDGLQEVLLGLDKALEAIRAGVPHVVCDACKGDPEMMTRCERCRFGGYLPLWRFQELKDEEVYAD